MKNLVFLLLGVLFFSGCRSMNEDYHEDKRGIYERQLEPVPPDPNNPARY
jgi:hypothetical protein